MKRNKKNIKIAIHSFLLKEIILVSLLVFSVHIKAQVTKNRVPLLSKNESMYNEDNIKALDSITAGENIDFNSDAPKSPGNYQTITNPTTKRIWLDRNIGASQVANASDDALSYGSLFQWGRAQEGHEDRSSTTYDTFSNPPVDTWIADEGSNAWDEKFVTWSGDWLDTAKTDLWSGCNSENNPCPSGYRLPTNAEWLQEIRTWNSIDSNEAFSNLKLPLSGVRDFLGSVSEEGTKGYYWSSTAKASSSQSYILSFNNATGEVEILNRAYGASVRCIKD